MIPNDNFCKFMVTKWFAEDLSKSGNYIKSETKTYAPQLTYEEKEKIFNNAKLKLKEYFIGIDDIIDNIFESIKTWYFFPEVLTRPVIINLYGLTGVGKTDLVKKLVKYIGLADKFCNIELNNDTNYSFEEDKDKRGDNIKYNFSILDNIINTNIKQDTQSVLLLDEIHRFRTIDESNHEYINSAYNDVWNLLSDGNLYDASIILKYIQTQIKKLQRCFSVAQNTDLLRIPSNNYVDKMLINMGISVKNEEMDNSWLEDPVLTDAQRVFYKNQEKKNAERRRTQIDIFNSENGYVVNTDFLANILIYTKKDIDVIKKLRVEYQGIHCMFDNYELENFNSLNKILRMCSNKVMLEFLSYKYNELKGEFDELSIEEKILKQEEYVYSKMLIFVCGNLDVNLYEDDNYYMPPNKEKIINFLNERFRPEQVARFGDNYVIYPVLSLNDFGKLINKEISLKEKRLQEEFNDTSLVFDRKQIIDELDKCGFNRTMGVRPVLSLVGNILAKIIPNMLLEKINKREGEKL